MVGCTVSEAEIDKLEAQLLAKRQAKQISVSITLGLMTIVFLDSIYILSTVLHAIEGTEIFLYLLIFTIYAVGGAFALGTLARALDPGDFRQTLEKIALYKYGDASPLTPADVAAMAPATIEAEVDDLIAAVADRRPADPQRQVIDLERRLKGADQPLGGMPGGLGAIEAL